MLKGRIWVYTCTQWTFYPINFQVVTLVHVFWVLLVEFGVVRGVVVRLLCCLLKVYRLSNQSDGILPTLTH